MNALRFLQAHPVPVQAHFENVLVLTYAFPETTLRGFLPPGLCLDTYEKLGFLAIAMVQTRKMRPRFAPELIGGDFFLTGYRIFTRFRTTSGKTLRGLRILRSDTDSDFMARWGNLLTHYNYQKASVECSKQAGLLEVKVHTSNAEADLHVRAHLSPKPAALPEASPFPTLQVARRFGGPLPFTFDYETETHSIIRIQGVRQAWNPMPTRVEVLQNTFIDKPPFADAPPILASAFHLANVPYRWKRGVREHVSA